MGWMPLVGICSGSPANFSEKLEEIVAEGDEAIRDVADVDVVGFSGGITAALLLLLDEFFVKIPLTNFADDVIPLELWLFPTELDRSKEGEDFLV